MTIDFVIFIVFLFIVFWAGIYFIIPPLNRLFIRISCWIFKVNYREYMEIRKNARH